MSSLLHKIRSTFHSSIEKEGKETVGEMMRAYRLSRAFWLESALFFGVVLGIDALFYDGLRFAGADFHPFWILVVLASTQYGVGEGLLAVGLSVFFLLAGNMPEQQITQDSFEYYQELVTLPLLWLLTAVVLGEIRNRQAGVIRKFESNAVELERSNAKLYEKYNDMAETNKQLEQRIVGDMGTVLSVYEAARALEKLDSSEVVRGISELVRTLLEPEKFSVFILEGSKLKAVVTSGWKDKDPYRRSYDQNSNMLEQVVGGQKFLNVTAETDSKILAGEGVMAGPMLVEETGEVVGMLKIEKLAFLKLDKLALENFKVVCRWVGTAYANVKAYEKSRDESVIDPEKNLMTASFFNRQTVFLKSLAQRIGFPVSMIFFSIANVAEMEKDQIVSIARHISESAKVILRGTDMAFDAPKKGVSFAIVLPNTPADFAQFVVDKFMDDFTKRTGMDEQTLMVDVQLLHQPEKAGDE